MNLVNNIYEGPRKSRWVLFRVNEYYYLVPEGKEATLANSTAYGRKIFLDKFKLIEEVGNAR